jgi:hypothetical protein
MIGYTRDSMSFRLGYTCEFQFITLCQDIADPLDEGEFTDAIIIEFSKAFDLVPHDRLLTKSATSGMDSCVAVRLREFLVRRTQRVSVWGQLSKVVQISSGVPQGNIFCPLLFLVYVNDIWKNIDTSIRLFAHKSIIYRKITNKNDTENLQNFLNNLGQWAMENGIKINLGKCKAIRFSRARVKNPLG